MKIKEQIAVMQAFADGKKIEVRPSYLTDKNDWVAAPTPVWNWAFFDYRIKSESKLRPYTFEELQAEMAKGKIVVKQKGEAKRILTITQAMGEYGGYKSLIYLSDNICCSYEQLLEYYQWLDNSSCGVIEGE
jgi:hypothetical protein